MFIRILEIVRETKDNNFTRAILSKILDTLKKIVESNVILLKDISLVRKCVYIGGYLMVADNRIISVCNYPIVNGRVIIDDFARFNELIFQIGYCHYLIVKLSRPIFLVNWEHIDTSSYKFHEFIRKFAETYYDFLFEGR